MLCLDIDDVHVEEEEEEEDDIRAIVIDAFSGLDRRARCQGLCIGDELYILGFIPLVA